MAINLFNASFYRAANSDLAKFSDSDALSHFQQYGLDEGRVFSPFTNLNFYRSSNGDLANMSNRQAYDHLQNHGIGEGRRFSQFVDLKFYLDTNSDLAQTFAGNKVQAFEHLMNYGVKEGRQFSQFIDINFYLANNVDIAQAFATNKLAALEHFENYGLDEGRTFSVAFNVDWYRSNNSDLVAAQLNNRQLLDHFELYGVNEGRASAAVFNIKFYISNNADLQTAKFNYNQAYEHFVKYGLREGRNASQYISNDFTGNSLNTARYIALDNKEVIFRESVGNADSSDLYKFSLGMQRGTNLKVVLNGLSTNVDIELLNSSGQSVYSSINANTASESFSTNLHAGIYYIKVYPGLSNASSNYNLSLSATPLTTGNSFADQVVDLTNAQRIQAGLQPLLLNMQLTAAAQNHTRNMALLDFFSHTGADGSSASQRAQASGYPSSYVSENIGAGYTTPTEVVQGWMNSSGHRANILTSSFEDIGVGYYLLSNDRGNVNYNYYWTQNFGTVF